VLTNSREHHGKRRGKGGWEVWPEKRGMRSRTRERGHYRGEVIMRTLLGWPLTWRKGKRKLSARKILDRWKGVIPAKTRRKGRRITYRLLVNPQKGFSAAGHPPPAPQETQKNQKKNQQTPLKTPRPQKAKTTPRWEGQGGHRFTWSPAWEREEEKRGKRDLYFGELPISFSS